MAEALFDTTVFIDYYRGDPKAKELMGAVRTGQLTASFSPITTYEIWIGISNRDEEMHFESVMRRFEEANLNTNMAKRAAYWLRDLTTRPREEIIRDALIAATAAERAETIYTRNVADFQRFYPNVQSY